MADAGRNRWAGQVVRFRTLTRTARTFTAPHPPPSLHRSVPYLGMVTILLNDYPWFKFVLLGVMGLFVLTSREQ